MITHLHELEQRRLHRFCRAYVLCLDGVHTLHKNALARMRARRKAPTRACMRDSHVFCPHGQAAGRANLDMQVHLVFQRMWHAVAAKGHLCCARVSERARAQIEHTSARDRNTEVARCRPYPAVVVCAGGCLSLNSGERAPSGCAHESREPAPELPLGFGSASCAGHCRACGLRCASQTWC